MRLPINVRIEVEGGVVQDVGVLDADGKPVEFVYELVDRDVDGTEDEDDDDGKIPCQRCGSSLDVNSEFCTDVTCPFSDHTQFCRAGWAGHPIAGDRLGSCTCTCRERSDNTCS